MPLADPESRRAWMREYVSRNRAAKQEYDREYRAQNSARRNASARRYYQLNKAAIHEYQRKKRKTDLNFRLSDSLRSRLRSALSGKQKNGSAVEDLGCSIPEFRLYIEHQFEEGMNWDNYGAVWELDHVIPLNQFDLSNRMELLEACNWLNIRPLSCEDNRSRPRKMLGASI